MTQKPQVAFIGLGLMGAALTKRLTGLGYPVSGYDTNAAKVAAATAWGVRPAASAAAAAEQADIIQVCVLETRSVQDIVLGANGIATVGSAQQILIDHGTTELTATRDMAHELAERCGTAWIDAPVSGGPTAAEQGTLAIMAGGGDAAFAKAAPLLADLATSYTHMGGIGAGQLTKMVNQALVLSNYCVIAEAAKLAEAGGIDLHKLPDALAAGHAGSNLLPVLLPRIAARDFEPLGRARQVLKDLNMLYELSQTLQTPIPMADQARDLFRQLCAQGDADLDGAAVFKLFDRVVNDGSTGSRRRPV